MPRSLANHPIAASHPAWDKVRRWPGLSGEAKLTWLYLWELAGGLATIPVHVGAVSADQGTTDRCGRRSLESLAAQGLACIVDKDRGLWTVRLEDPAVVARARLLSPEPQQQFEFALPPAEPSPGRPDVLTLTDPAVVAQHPPNEPAVVAQQLPRQGKSNTLTPTLNPSDFLGGNTLGDPAAAVVAQQPPDRAAGADEPLLLAESLGQVFDLAAWKAKLVGTQAERAQEVAGSLLRRVGDPNLAPQIAGHVAWAVVHGTLPEAKLEAVLGRLPREGPRERGQYFVAALRSVFREIGLLWYNERAPPAKG
jgi:hypothetical protein